MYYGKIRKRKRKKNQEQQQKISSYGELRLMMQKASNGFGKIQGRSVLKDVEAGRLWYGV